MYDHVYKCVTYKYFYFDKKTNNLIFIHLTLTNSYKTNVLKISLFSKIKYHFLASLFTYTTNKNSEVFVYAYLFISIAKNQEINCIFIL